jgi:hypothetical protein
MVNSKEDLLYGLNRLAICQVYIDRDVDNMATGRWCIVGEDQATFSPQFRGRDRYA